MQTKANTRGIGRTTWERPDWHREPEKRLWLNVIYAAVLDWWRLEYLVAAIERSTDGREIERLSFRLIESRRELRGFFFARRAEPHNLRWICEMIAVDPDGLREAAIRALNRPRRVQESRRLKQWGI